MTAKEFVPNSVLKNRSSELCPSEEKYQVSNSACDNKSEKSSGKFPKFNTPSKQTSPVTERKCVRCKKIFQTFVGGGYLEQEECRYHWGKVRAGEQLTCCGARARRPGGGGAGGGAGGCTLAPAHVWSGLPQNTHIVGPLEGYVKTKHRKTYPTNGNFGVVGLDCEMCYTSQGLELVKVLPPKSSPYL